MNHEQQQPNRNNMTPTWDVVTERVRAWRPQLAALPFGGPAALRGIDLALADMDERDRMGAARYGTRLQPHNGRDPLLDAYQELLDATVYAASDAIELGVDLSRTMVVYTLGPGGLPMVFGCTFQYLDGEPGLSPMQQMAAARFWKVLDLAVTFRMEIEERQKRDAVAS